MTDYLNKYKKEVSKGFSMTQNILNFYSQVMYLGITAALILITVFVLICLCSDVDVMNHTSELPWGVMILGGLVAGSVPYIVYQLLIKYVPNNFRPEVMMVHHKPNVYPILSWIATYSGGLIVFGIVGVVLLILMARSIERTFSLDVYWSLDNSEKVPFSWNRSISTGFGFLIFNGYLNYYFNRELAIVPIIAGVIISLMMILIGYYLSYIQTVKEHNSYVVKRS